MEFIITNFNDFVNEAITPGEKKVAAFVTKTAKEYGYSESDAVFFIKSTIEKLGLGVDESLVIYESMSDLDLIAKESKDFKDFAKQAKKEYPQFAKGDDKELIQWLQSIYDSAIDESSSKLIDFNLKPGVILNFKDGETWKVTKVIGNANNPRGILATPYGDTKKQYVSVAIEFTMDQLKSVEALDESNVNKNNKLSITKTSRVTGGHNPTIRFDFSDGEELQTKADGYGIENEDEIYQTLISKWFQNESVEALDESTLSIEVSVRDARKANEILRDNGNIKYKNDGSNVFIFKKKSSYEDALEAFGNLEIEIIVESNNTEGKITLKRQYTENHPAIRVGHHAKIRNKVIEALKDGQITQEEFYTILKEMTSDSARWMKRNSHYFNVSEDGITLSKTGSTVLKGILTEKTTKNPEVWVPGGFDKEISKYPNKKIDIGVVSKLARKYEVDLEDAIKYVEYGWAIDLQENINNTIMKHVKLFEAFVNEKAYRMTGPYSAKGIVGKVLQSFKKQIERVQYNGDADDTLKEVNKEWEKFFESATDIILEEVEKAVKSMDGVLFVSATLTKEWTADVINKLNREGSDTLHISPGEIVINVGFMDDVNAQKYSRKLGGMTNAPTESNGSVDLHGSFDMSVGDNNVEIRATEVIQIDSK